MKKNNKIKILLVDGGDRQTIALAKALKKLGYIVVTLNSSKLDIGYVSHYPDKRIVVHGINDNITLRTKVIKKCIMSGRIDVVITTSDDTAEALSLMKESCKDKTHIAVVNPDLFYMAYDNLYELDDKNLFQKYFDIKSLIY